MKTIYFSAFLALITTLTVTGMSTYDRATLFAQKGEWEKANETIQAVVVNRHESPKILYDAGVTSFKTKQYKEAAAYFEHAAHHKNINAELKEQALFNAGNAHVALRDFPTAITSYQLVLTQNPDHARAQHNLAKVKELLKQQQEQEKQDQDSSKKSDKKDEQQQKQSSGSDKDNRDTQAEQQKTNNADDNQKRDKQQQLDKKPSQEQQKSTEKNSSDHTNTPEKESPQKTPTEQPKEPTPTEQQKSPKKQESLKKPAEKQQSHTPLQPQSSETQKPTPSQDTSEQKDAQATKNSPAEPKTAQEQWLIDLLEERDKADAEASKQLMKSIIGTQTTGNYGNNGKKCW